MGNADLRDLSHITEVDIDDLEGATVAVDAPNWLYKYMTTISRFTADDAYTTDDGRELPTLIGVPRGLIRFFENHMRPVFIFDGDPHERKADEIQSRREAKEKAAAKAEEARERGDDIAAARYESRTQRLDDDVIQTTKDLLDLFDVPYLTAPTAAEAQAAHMAAMHDFEYVVSDDYDALLFGAPKTVRNFTSSSKPLEVLDLEATCDDHALTVSQLVDVGLLCGTDYNDGVHGVGVKTALSGVSEYGDLEGVLESKGKEMSDVDALRDIFLNPPVTNDLPDPRSPNPDLDGVRSYLDELGIDVSQVESALDQIQDATAQQGLDRW